MARRPILVLLLMAGVARADDPKAGDKVVTKYAKLLVDGDRAVDDGTAFRIFTVEKVEGASVRVTAGRVAGTFAIADVVRLDDAEGFYEGEIRRDPARAPAAHGRRSFARRTRGDLDGALADAGEAIRLRPENAWFRNNRGLYLANGKKDHAAAIADYDEAIRLDSSRAAFRRNRAISRRALGDTAGAIADLDEAIQISPKDAALHDDRGYIRGLLKQFDRAVADYDRAIAIDRDYTQAYINRGYARTALKQAARAVADFDRAIKLEPQSANALNGRGLALRARGQYGKAAADLDEALRLQPENAARLIARAQLWATCPEARYRDGKKAVDAATRASELTAWKGPYALDALAAALAESGDFDQAARREQEAIDQTPAAEADRDELARRRERLALYRGKKPLRQP